MADCLAHESILVFYLLQVSLPITMQLKLQLISLLNHGKGSGIMVLLVSTLDSSFQMLEVKFCFLRIEMLQFHIVVC